MLMSESQSNISTDHNFTYSVFNYGVKNALLKRSSDASYWKSNEYKSSLSLHRSTANIVVRMHINHHNRSILYHTYVHTYIHTSYHRFISVPLFDDTSSRLDTIDTVNDYYIVLKIFM